MKVWPEVKGGSLPLVCSGQATSGVLSPVQERQVTYRGSSVEGYKENKHLLYEERLELLSLVETERECYQYLQISKG